MTAQAVQAPRYVNGFPRVEICACSNPYRRCSGVQNKCPECFKQARRLRSARPENWIKSEAQKAVQAAVKRGDLVRQPCEYLAGDKECGLDPCGKTPTHGHHEDYAKPLDVIWLCAGHHRWHHGMGKPKERLPARVREVVE